MMFATKPSSRFVLVNFRKLNFAVVAVLLACLTPKLSLAQSETLSFEFEGMTRDFIVYLPQNYNTDSSFPVVFNLHGYGSNSVEQQFYANMNPVADSSGFIAVYPNAVDNAWNSGISDNPLAPTPDVDDVGFISAIIDFMNDNYSVDLKRVYSCGMSNGGFMSHRLACELSNRIAAIASVTGVIANSVAASCAPERPMPVLYIHGTTDPVVPFSGAAGWHSAEQTVAHWTTTHNQCAQVNTVAFTDSDPTDGCTVEKTTYSDCEDNTSVLFYKVTNGGHTWPGAPINLDNNGNTNRDINASAEIWDFLKQYSLEDKATSVAGNAPGIVPSDYTLYANFPNPFNPSTTIRYFMREPGLVKLQIFNLLGQEVATLVNTRQPTGFHNVSWNSAAVSSGVYLYRLQVGNFVQTNKMTLLK